MKISIGPGLTLALVWIVPLLIPLFIQNNDLIVPVGSGTIILVVSNVVLFTLCLYIFNLIGRPGSLLRVRAAIEKIDFDVFCKKVIVLYKFWIFIYVVNIIGSGGMPLFWILNGDPRTYADFGLPTLGGLGNLLRAYVLSSCYLIYYFSNLSKSTKNKFKYIGFFLISSAFILETGRGNGVVLLLHPIGLFLLLNEFRLKGFIKLVLISSALVFSLGLIQMVRYEDGYNQLLTYSENSGFKDVGIAEAIMIPTIMYVAVPVVNTDLNFQISDFLKFSPYYSLQGIIPTIIRDAIFERGDYGELVNDANNVSSYYIPFIRDFGQFGSFIAVAIILMMVAYCYSKARRGKLFYILCYPPLFMGLALSFFSLFFTSLVVLLYPILVSWSLKGGLNKNV